MHIQIFKIEKTFKAQTKNYLHNNIEAYIIKLHFVLKYSKMKKKKKDIQNPNQFTQYYESIYKIALAP